MRILAPNHAVVDELLAAGYIATALENDPFAYETNAELKLNENFVCGNVTLRMVREDGLTFKVAKPNDLKKYGL